MDPITPPTSELNTASTVTVPNPSSAPNAGSKYFNNSIFWIEVEKIVPNPYQPRREFDPHALKDLSESIRMYGLLQPLVVLRDLFRALNVLLETLLNRLDHRFEQHVGLAEIAGVAGGD